MYVVFWRRISLDAVRVLDSDVVLQFAAQAVVWHDLATTCDKTHFYKVKWGRKRTVEEGDDMRSNVWYIPYHAINHLAQ